MPYQINQGNIWALVSLSLYNKLVFIDSFQFLSSSLYSLAKTSSENNFKHLIQEFDTQVLDLSQKKGFYPYKYMCNFGKFTEELPHKSG